MSGAGRTLPRRLGIGVVPAQSESFPSWVDRMAVRMQTGPGRVARELGIELRPDGGHAVAPTTYGISMSRRDLESVHAATGVSPDAVSAMLLSVYDGTVLDLSSLGPGTVGGQSWKGAWALFRGSRCCPDCVAASAGAWQLWWRLGGAAACPEHRVLLHGRCPRCGLPLRWNSSHLPTRTPYPDGGLTACTNRVPRDDGSRSACGFPIAELPVRPAPAEVLEVQDLYLRAAAGQALRLAGKEVAPPDWFAEISQLVALARLAGPQEFPGAGALPELYARAWREDHAAEESGRTWLWRAHPPSPELTAAILHALSPVLRSASEPEFRDAASWLLSTAYRRRELRNVRGFDLKILPPFTRRAFLTSPHRGTSKVFLGKFLHPEPQLARLGLAADHIPWHADRDDVLEQVTPHLVPRQEAEPGGWPQRRFAALCLAIMVSGARTWDEAAEKLGLAPVAGGRRKPPGDLTVADLPAFREGLIMLGSRLAERGLVDYRARRAALAGLTEMPAGDWAGRPTATARHRREHHPDRSQVFAAAWIWSDLTGGRYDESPAWAALTDSDAPVVTSMGSRRNYSKFYGSWQHGQGPARRDWLRSQGARYLEDRDCRGALR